MGPVDPAFVALWTGYRNALANGDAKQVGTGVAFGHRVYWLRFRSVDPKSPGSEIAVDADTYKPVVYRVYNGAQAIDQHILLAETTDFSAADFTHRGSGFGAGSSLGSGIVSSGGGSVMPNGSKPSTVVPHGWLTAGPTADGEKLTAVVPRTVTLDNKPAIDGYELVYGPLKDGLAAEGATTVDESRRQTTRPRGPTSRAEPSTSSRARPADPAAVTSNGPATSSRTAATSRSPPSRANKRWSTLHERSVQPSNRNGRRRS